MLGGLIKVFGDEFYMRLISIILGFFVVMFSFLGIGMEWVDSWI